MRYSPFGPNWFNHQRQYFEERVDDDSFALFWEQGTAKSKPIVDTISYQWQKKNINAAVIVAPPGVEIGWLTEQFPTHCHPDIRRQIGNLIYTSSDSLRKNWKQRWKQFVSYQGLIICYLSYNAYMTKRARDDLWNLFRKRDVFMCLDESHNIKTPAAKRTKSLIAAGKYPVMKRILTGTPIAQGPFDIYSQLRFLDSKYWHSRGISTFAEFKQRFGIWELAADVKKEEGWDPGFDRLITYKDLDLLKAYTDYISSRVLKDDVLDLPPKLYSKRFFEMSRMQEDLYNELRDEYIAEFEDQEIDGELAIVRLLRLQQITCGYIKQNALEPAILIDQKNPRVETLKDIVEETYHQGIIWARFREDVNQIMDLLGDRAARYDGSISREEAEANKVAFQKGEFQWFVGTASKGGSGLNLQMAKTIIYYNNSFKLIDRLQSEDRAHRPGMDEHPVHIIDICCHGTVDTKIIENLRKKVDIASQLTGDELKEWL